MDNREFITTGDARIDESVDLEQCHNDPIQQTALIQPHGVFFQLDPADFSILAVSRNLSEYLPQEVEEVLSEPVTSVLNDESVGYLRQLYQDSVLEREHFTLNAGGDTFLASVYSVGQTLGLELEPHEEPSQTSTELIFREDTVLKRIKAARSKSNLFDTLAGLVQVTLGYDRVIVLNFEHEGHGHVVAESKDPEMDSYLDQYFPASDIPEPARRIYRLTDIRYIPRSEYEPVSVVDTDGELSREDLDLTYSTLRNVPLIHRKYMQNMNVGASISVPLMVDDDLWGLITAHKRGSGFVDWHTRYLTKLVGQYASAEIENLEAEEREERQRAVETFRKSYLQTPGSEDDLFGFLDRSAEDLLEVLNSNAFYMKFDKRVHWLADSNQDPPSEALFDWIVSRLETDGMVVTKSLESELDESLHVPEEFSGLLAMNVTQSREHYCVWFRPEQESKKQWGGDPRNPVTVDDSNELNPRRSFEEWTQIIQGQCRRWTEIDKVIARDLIHIFNDVALEEQSKKLREANHELETQNDELQRIKEMLEEKNDELKKANEKLEELSYYDELTGAPNRRLFEETLRTKWELLTRENSPLSLLMIDIDHFKEYNDHYGHPTGDECLQKVARIIRERARRGSDTVARYGGEEFAVILPDTSESDAAEIAETMREAVKALGIPHEYSPTADVVTVSLGVATFDDLSGKNRDDLVEAADQALYEAKESGRDRVVVD
ncbi:MAG: diguanylate cyclase [bacterium]